MHYIYCITNIVNNKKYIGRTNDIHRRIIQHKNDSCNPTCSNKYNTPLAQAIQKYGWENFTWEILDQNEDADTINQLEIDYIKKYNTYGESGYNASIGGEYGYSGRVYHSKIEDCIKDIILDLQNNILSLKEISEKYNISYSYVSDINNGSRLKQNDINYPLRPPPTSKLIDIYPDIIYDLQFSNLSMRALAKKYNTTLSTIQSINKGNKTAQQFYDNFPIR